MIALPFSLAAAATVALQAASPAPAAPVAAPVAAPASARLVAAATLTDLPDLTLLGYEVTGNTARALRVSLNARRPAEEAGGARHDARTRWSYRPRWQVGADGRCDPATATVALSLTIVLPDLGSRDRLSDADRAAWDRYFAALVAHERNHGRIAVAGRDLMQTALRASADCDSLRAAVQAHLAEVAAASRTYDARTEHGRREGAIFPPPGPRSPG